MKTELDTLTLEYGFVLKAQAVSTAVFFAGILLSPVTAVAVDLGWQLVKVPSTDTYALRYVPSNLDLEHPAPVVIFLHGSGAMPVNYRNFVATAADRAGCVLILPKSIDDTGWGHASDKKTIDDALGIVQSEINLDHTRIAIAGHSSGGAYAGILAYSTRSGYSAVFSLSAPFMPISAIADPAYSAPIRMYYGMSDPNYMNGAFTRYQAMWHELGVPMESEILAGFGHNTWPDSVMENGFLFLVRHSYPTPPRRWRRAPIRRIGP